MPEGRNTNPDFNRAFSDAEKQAGNVDGKVQDAAGDLYGQNIDVAFIDWIREERMFDSAGALIQQMQDDSRIAHEVLARSGDKFPPI